MSYRLRFLRTARSERVRISLELHGCEDACFLVERAELRRLVELELEGEGWTSLAAGELELEEADELRPGAYYAPGFRAVTPCPHATLRTTGVAIGGTGTKAATYGWRTTCEQCGKVLEPFSPFRPIQ